MNIDLRSIRSDLFDMHLIEYLDQLDALLLESSENQNTKVCEVLAKLRSPLFHLRDQLEGFMANDAVFQEIIERHALEAEVESEKIKRQQAEDERDRALREASQLMAENAEKADLDPFKKDLILEALKPGCQRTAAQVAEFAKVDAERCLRLLTELKAERKIGSSAGVQFSRTPMQPGFWFLLQPGRARLKEIGRL